MSGDEYTPSEEAVERAARAIDTRGWWFRAWWPAEYHGDTRNQTEHEDAYRNGLRAQARAALVAAGPPDLTQHNLAVKAAAWDEGAKAGLDKGLDIAELVHEGGGTLDLAKVPPPPLNPYRIERGEGL